MLILPGYKRQAVADQVHDAGLHHGLRIDRGDRLGKALEPIDHRDQDIVDAPRLQVVDDLEPEFGAFGLLDPQAQNLLLAVRIESQRDIDGLVPDHAFIANLDPQCVEKHHWIDRVERTGLPFPDFVENRVGYPAHQPKIGPIKFR